MNRTRLVMILVVLFLIAGVAFVYGTCWFERELRDQPYVASVMNELRALAAAQDSFLVRQGFYTNDVTQLPQYRVRDQDVRVEIRDASTEGFLAEGRHESWRGRCLVAAGPFAGDSLSPGEPKCFWSYGPMTSAAISSTTLVDSSAGGRGSF